ncbi:MAG TPA: hypothetical protein VF384_19190 [Planctomycetota bacterium]
MSAPASGPLPEPVAFLRDAAPWLQAPELGVCIVGSHALALACRANGLPAPAPVDLDLAWALDHEAGTALLQQHGVLVPTTEGNRQRGTLAMKVGGRRLEITTFRAGKPGEPMPARIAADLGERDMTIGALAFELATATLHDPAHGLDDWQKRIIAPVGNAAHRVKEHPIRWLRYYRKAHELGFCLERSIRRIALPPSILRELPREAVALELRAMLGRCPSPGRCLLELHEAGLLEVISPELVRQFDGRPAGPQRWHPEVSQGLHLILALEWAVAQTRHLDERGRLAVLIAVLCHDLGKGYTRSEDLPNHHGHENAGLAHLDRLLARWPGLADQRAHALARHVCALHLQIRDFGSLRPGTQAQLYDNYFRQVDYPIEQFALAVAADAAGRLGSHDLGKAVCAQVTEDLGWLRTTCATVDAAALRQQWPDVEKFRMALHEARSRALAAHLHERDHGQNGPAADRPRS